jgi:hypothetical protein
MTYIERKTEGHRTVVVFKYAALYYYVMWPTIVISVLAGSTPQCHYVIVAASCWVVLVGLALPMWPTVLEVKQAMKRGGVKASGSKWSFSNPLRYEWETESKP